MKNVPIKFRGLTVGSFRTIYGVGVVYGKINPHTAYLIQDDFTTEQVIFDSIKQLIGYDADGNEIYEGDRIIFCGNKLVPFGGKILFEIAELRTNYPLEKYTKYIPEDDNSG